MLCKRENICILLEQEIYMATHILIMPLKTCSVVDFREELLLTNNSYSAM